MTRNFFILFLLLINMYASAQDIKNKKILNVNANYHSQNKNEDADSIYNRYEESGGRLMLNAGHYFTNRFAAGITGAYTLNILRNSEFDAVDGYFGEKIITSYYSVGLFQRYNCMIKGQKLGFFFQFNELFNFGKTHYTASQKSLGPNSYQNSTDKTYGTTLSLVPSILYVVNNKFSIEASIGNAYYDYRVTVPDGIKLNKIKISDASLDFSFHAITLGISFYLGGRALGTD